MQLRLPWLRERLPLLALAGLDSLVIFGAYGLVFRLRMGSWWGQPWQAFSLGVSWLSISYLVGRYSKESVLQPRRKPWHSKTLLAIILILATIQAQSWTFRNTSDGTLYRGFIVPFLLILTTATVAGQHFIKQKLRKRAGPWLIVATPEECDIVKSELENSELTYTHNLTTVKFCNFETLAKALALEPVEGVAISQAILRKQRPGQSLVKARQKGMTCCSLDAWCEKTLQRLPPELFDSDGVLVADDYQLQPGTTSWRIKRLGDVLISLSLILLSAPLVIGAMILIKLEDGKDIFYQQRRTGLFGQPIQVKKLRTMHTDAEKEGAQWARKEDDRITRVGRWLRRFRIDELPQLFSVVHGEMSLIGPRPERPELEIELESKIPNYRLRHWVRPGLSGWAQVCAPYGASVEDSRTKLSYDLYYLRNANILLDLLILLKTIRLIAGAKGSSPKENKNKKSK